jgi:hypothetical protein
MIAEIAMIAVERKLPPKRMSEPLVDCFAISMSEKDEHLADCQAVDFVLKKER